ncbi:MAG: hypothetical protein EYC70_00410 [Planctomycetota bacterium]|nr:MAG: hypothetical protein EYC70_00410 [Planctomycetota bacterium]
MIDVAVVIDTRQVQHLLDQLPTKQLPFATSLALNWLGKDAQAEVRQRLPAIFELRSDWVQRGIQMTPAQKRDWPNSAAVVGSRDAFLVQHETGAVKTARSGRLAIPARGAAVRGAGGRIPRSRKPRALLARRRTFINTIRSGQQKLEHTGTHRSRNAGLPAILQRVGKKRYPLRVIYVLRPRGIIRRTLGMHETVEAVVRARYGAKFRQAIEYALRTERLIV